MRDRGRSAINALLVANLETLGVVDAQAAAADRLGVAHWHELECDAARLLRGRKVLADR